MMCMTKEDKRRYKCCIDKMRSQEVLQSVLLQLETGAYDEDDFDRPIEEVKKDVKSIDIKTFRKEHKMEELEDKLFDIMGENFILYIPEESKLIKQMKDIYIKKRPL